MIFLYLLSTVAGHLDDSDVQAPSLNRLVMSKVLSVNTICKIIGSLHLIAIFPSLLKNKW
jgi:hypothetical protein